MKQKVSIFWYRRDLRLSDNHALHLALKSGVPVLPIFIFDEEIIAELPRDDARLTFIYDTLVGLNTVLSQHSSGIHCLRGKPLELYRNLMHEFEITAVYANEDYEPYARARDAEVAAILAEEQIEFVLTKDQVVFAKDQVLKKDHSPYTVYTPYKNKWLQYYTDQNQTKYPIELWDNFAKIQKNFPSLSSLGFERSAIPVLPFDLADLDDYDRTRDIPAINGTSKLGPHLRFGTVSIREVIESTGANAVFLSELIWREFFMQILYHFPRVVAHNFKRKYDKISWRNDPEEFEKWKNGQTGYPMVDAGMRELKATGYMHNRVRMVTAGFLCKHLLIDWQWGEAYFASKLVDYDLAANNGNWQWAAGTGCDAAPYFRVFNPTAQVQRFDPDLTYVKKWVPELNSLDYPTPMVEHKFARERAINTYKVGLG